MATDLRSDLAVAGLTKAVRAALARHGSGGVTVTGRALGVRDELAVPAGDTEPGDVSVYVYGHTAVIGPLHHGGVTAPACGRCLARRWQAVRPEDIRDALETGGDTHACGDHPFLTPFTADAVAGVIAAHVVGHRDVTTSAPYSTVCLVNLETLEVQQVPLVPDADCPECGRRTPDTPEAAEVALEPTPKPVPDVFRTRRLGDFDLPVGAFANAVSGALGPAPFLELDSPTASSTLGWFSLRTGPYLHKTYWAGHTNSYGDSIRVGIMEGLERYAGTRPRSKTATVVASFEELGDQALDPRRCGVYSDEFYEHDGRMAPFSEKRPMPWVWGWSLRDRRPVLVPEIITYYNSSTTEAPFVQECSNGCASGGSLVEAAFHGLMELIERDAFLLAWYGMAALPEIDPHSSSRPDTRMMVDRLAMYGYEARFFDTRITFPVPVVTGVAIRKDGGLGTMCFGAGASLDPEEAVAGALAEIGTDAARLRLRTELQLAELREMARDFDKVRALNDHPGLYGLPEMAPYASFLLDGARDARPLVEVFGDGRPVLRPSVDLSEDLAACVDAVASAGFDTIVVEQTLPEQRDMGLSTASVIVPGLLPIDFGWGRQRALHMPRTRTALREAGLRGDDLTRDQLNPAPHPFP
ncbi:TOMM precursor leader peptide-binding protein [Streptomyces sp. NPDC001127]|uniref:TOMM precursor leader peptide-binding protein n=1 Tax=unclassified Streptomyces TaxID=2593676 RepID=UPI003324DD46